MAMARALLRALDLCLSFGLGRSIPFAGCALGLGQRRSELDRAKVQKAKPVLGGSKGSVLHEGVCLTIRTLGNPGSAGLGLGLGWGVRRHAHHEGLAGFDPVRRVGYGCALRGDHAPLDQRLDAGARQVGQSDGQPFVQAGADLGGIDRFRVEDLLHYESHLSIMADPIRFGEHGLKRTA